MVGTRCGLFQIKRIGEEYFTFMIDCKEPKACTIVLRGASKDVLNEMERNLLDAFNVSRNLLLEPKLLPGGGATEMEIAARLKEKAKSIEGVRQYPYRAVADALEVIPRSLAHNCGADVVRTMTDLRSRHAPSDGAGKNFGLDGNKGTVVDTMELGVRDSFVVKIQTIKTAIESAAMLLRIDDIVSGMSKKKGGGGPQQPAHDTDMDPEAFGDQRDG